MLILYSKVPDHKGLCTPIWLNRNQIYNRIDGGISGFFRNIERRLWFFGYKKIGSEFHGLILNNEVILPSIWRQEREQTIHNQRIHNQLVTK